jgi:ABC-2 type transport system ATP-binding protein
MTGSGSGPVLSFRGVCRDARTGHIIQGRKPILADLTFDVLPGEVFGYVGPNGAGKTTTLKILMGLVRADAGAISVLGLPLGDRTWRHRVGYLPEHPYLYDYLTATEYLDYIGSLFGQSRRKRTERARELLALVGLEGDAHVPMRRFSKGMLQRAGLAQALINDPEFVVLDEPMSGLDPMGRRLARNLILHLRDSGKTVLFSTHILSDAETLCDRVGVLRGGKLLRVGALGEMLRLDASHLEVWMTPGRANLVDFAGVLTSRMVGDRVRLEIEETALARVVTAIEERGGHVLGVVPVRETLEDYFVREMGGEPGGGSGWQGA